MQPKLTLLSDELIPRILEEAYELLQCPGVKVQNPEARELLAEAGAKLYPENQVIGIPAALIHKALESVPREFYLYDYDDKPVIHYGGDTVHFDPGSSGIAMLNPETLEHDTTETSHLIRLLKVAELLPQYDAQSTAVICHDVPKDIQDSYRLYLALLYSKKPIVTGAFSNKTVQEMIDMCDFATGLSRQLYGLTIASERPQHRLYEQWHPLGPIGIITAFNFPAAVWSWNAALAAVSGDTMVWKPSPAAPLTAIAIQHICNRVMAEHGVDGVFTLAIGDNEEVAERMINDERLPLISFTGSIRVGKHVAKTVAGRLGRTILELGGNNGIIVTEDANLDLAVHGIAFGAVGTAGQRCTSTRRIIVHESIKGQLVERLVDAYRGVRVGDPRDPRTLMGPLVTREAVGDMQRAIQRLKAEGGEVVYGGEPLEGQQYPGGHYVRPCIATAKNDYAIVQEETFAPILYIIGYGRRTSSPEQAVGELDQAVALHNGVPQGLSSAIFTDHLREAERFLSQRGSDCGIANVNIGTSGAEIGGAFGGEKETGGGRESGSDAWKLYMRRQTNTINWSTELPLAQGIRFGDG